VAIVCGVSAPRGSKQKAVLAFHPCAYKLLGQLKSHGFVRQCLILANASLDLADRRSERCNMSSTCTKPVDGDVPLDAQADCLSTDLRKSVQKDRADLG